MGRDEAAAVLAGALLAGVATGMPRSVTGGLVADLGVADALDESRAALGEDEYFAALGRGGELSLDDVVAYVFDVLDVAAYAVP
jgi:hypothetical protein